MAVKFEILSIYRENCFKSNYYTEGNINPKELVIENLFVFDNMQVYLKEELFKRFHKLDDIEVIPFQKRVYLRFRSEDDTIGDSYERFVRKRTLVKYQSQSEVMKVMLYLVSHMKKPLNFENSNS